MNSRDLASDEIANIVDIFEQLKDVNSMIEIHQNDEDDLMSNQYLYRKEKLINELKELLNKFKIQPNDLVA